MLAISLWQPWAELVVLGAKRVETRDWCRPKMAGQRVLVHAALKWDDLCYGACLLDSAKAALTAAGLSVPDWTGRGRCPRPAFAMGAVVGAVTLREFFPSRLCFRQGGLHTVRWQDAPDATPYLTLSAADFELGDFGPGRWGWLLADPVRFAKPVFLPGRQSFFEVPPQFLPAIQEQLAPQPVAPVPASGR